MKPDEELAEIQACAEGALGWLDGYTDPFPDGEQRRVSQQTDGTWLFAPVQGSVFAQPRRVRIRVVVEDAEAGLAPLCAACGKFHDSTFACPGRPVLSDPTERLRP